MDSKRNTIVANSIQSAEKEIAELVKSMLNESIQESSSVESVDKEW